MDLIKIGKYIADKRKAHGFTQRQLADKLGVSDKSVSKWERGVCLPDVSLYLELCDVLGISINEFLAGEDIDTQDIAKKSENNLISVTADSCNKQRSLKRIIAVLLILAIVAFSFAGTLLLRQGKTENIIYPMDKNSSEMKIAELLSGADGAFLYKFISDESFKALEIYVSVYQNGELTGRYPVGLSNIFSSAHSEGMIAIVPDFENFAVKLVIASGSAKLSTDIPILEDVDGCEYLIRSAVQIDNTANIRYDEEQFLLALLYGKNELEVYDQSAYEKGDFKCDYAYLFSLKFAK